MKRCSTCNRTYTDPNLSFCVDDGTPLTTVNSGDEATVVSRRAGESGTDNGWSSAPYQPPSYVPPAAQPARRRRVWPWVVGILGAFILGIIAISIAAAILAPRFMRARQNEPARRSAEPTTNANRSENLNAAPAPENTNTGANVNTDVNVDIPPPTDHEAVLAQLTDLENEWTVANINADKRKLDRILADDYVGAAAEGGMQSKAEYIRTIQRDTQVEKWEFKDLKLTLAGDRATLSGRIKYETRDRDLNYDFTDKFVWRDGRWQATGSEVTPRN